VITANTISEVPVFHNVFRISGMKTLGSRIAHYRTAAKMSQAALAKACGWASQSRVGNYERDTREPSLDDISQIAKVLGVDQGKLLMAATTRPIESNAELIGTMSAWDGKTPLGDDEVAIPFYKEVELAAGCGSTEVIEVPGRLLRFAKSTLREASVLEANAVCATIKGRSMERLIMDGATIGIDTGTKHIEDGEIYAFDQDGMLRVKYLYRLPGGAVRVRSENDEEFPDETLTAEEFSRIRMLGWVFWWSTVRRRRGLSIAK
jgi:phage repressor protein C with HTH and peptisase S24 domain